MPCGYHDGYEYVAGTRRRRQTEVFSAWSDARQFITSAAHCKPQSGSCSIRLGSTVHREVDETELLPGPDERDKADSSATFTRGGEGMVIGEGAMVAEIPLSPSVLVSYPAGTMALKRQLFNFLAVMMVAVMSYTFGVHQGSVLNRHSEAQGHSEPRVLAAHPLEAFVDAAKEIEVEAETEAQATAAVHIARHPTAMPSRQPRGRQQYQPARQKPAGWGGRKQGAASLLVPGGKIPQVAICLGYTTRTSNKNKPKQAVYGIKGQSPLFNDLLPSLCLTKSPGFKYSIYVGYDHDDPLLSVKGTADLMKKAMEEAVNPQCNLDVHLIQMPYGGNPTWAQNDAVLAAHKAGADYFYRVNDDSVMSSNGWTEKFVSALGAMNPPYVGVVGPQHSGGNTAILTYDFTSRKHVDIFGFHYPREFRSWWGDDWITLVYKPHHMRKLPDVKLDHKLEDIRYNVGENKAQLGILQREVDLHKQTLQSYISKHQR